MLCICQWDVQETVKRIVQELQRRQYTVWFDLNDMKGSVRALALCVLSLAGLLQLFHHRFILLTPRNFCFANRADDGCYGSQPNSLTVFLWLLLLDKLPVERRGRGGGGYAILCFRKIVRLSHLHNDQTCSVGHNCCLDYRIVGVCRIS
eukprot:SAG31_NODE_1209_length_9381_cov_2.526611_3_plen_149_part_00